MEAVVGRANARAALKRVRQIQGSPGIDGMTVEDLPVYLAMEWKAIREQLLAGTCQPQPVRRQEIPKPGGGVRQLGIPTVLDRFIQQCLLQVLQPRSIAGEDREGLLRVARYGAYATRRRVFQVEVEGCPRCGGEVRIVEFVTEPAVAARILEHLARRGIEARARPWASAAAAPG